MEDYFKLQQKIAPEVVKVVERRYALLKEVYRFQPIGRRLLAEKLKLSERTVRKDLDFLKRNSLVKSTNAGTKITDQGSSILSELDGYIKKVRGTTELEEELSCILGLEVYVVPQGVREEQPKEELGRFSAEFIKNLVSQEDIMAVTGGTTLATVARIMEPEGSPCNITVVPGRGGLGEKVEIQANTIVAKIANKLGGNYQLLHIPDNLQQETMSRLIDEPSIKQILDLAKQADILVHGIGTAEVMAKRRRLPSKKIGELNEWGAVGESFGYYFNPDGEIVYSTPSVGLKLSDLDSIGQVIAIAGGKHKAEAILAVVSPKYQDVLITDEEAARAIVGFE